MRRSSHRKHPHGWKMPSARDSTALRAIPEALPACKGGNWVKLILPKPVRRFPLRPGMEAAAEMEEKSNTELENSPSVTLLRVSPW